MIDRYTIKWDNQTGKLAETCDRYRAVIVDESPAVQTCQEVSFVRLSHRPPCQTRPYYDVLGLMGLSE